MFHCGKKAGTHYVSTVLGGYNLDVYVDVENDLFSILVPTSPGGKVKLRERTSFEQISGKSLGEVKRLAKEFLLKRDQTDFHDVIECFVCTEGLGRNVVSFDFQVARVSTALDGQGGPKLEKPITVDENGTITEDLFEGKPMAPRHHGSRFMRDPVRLPFTVERWRKCVEIHTGIFKIRTALRDLFEVDDATSATRLDALERGGRLLGSLPVPSSPNDSDDEE